MTKRVFCAAAIAVGLSLLGAPAAQAQDEVLLDTIQLPASGAGKGTVALEAGEQYKLVVSGTRQRAAGDFREQSDAFYCFQDPPACRQPSPDGSVIHVFEPNGATLSLRQYVGDKVPPFSPSHEYTASFSPKKSGEFSATTATSCGGPPNECTGPGFTIKIFGKGSAPGGSDCTGDGCATLSGVSRKVEVSINQGAWERAKNGMKLGAGDSIHTGFKAGVTVTFVDGSTMQVKQLSLVKLVEVGRAPTGALRGILELTTGAVTVQVNRVTGSRGDFNVKTPTSTASTRGTIFTVTYNALTTLVAVTESSVLVTTNGGQAVEVPAGSQAEATATSVSALVPIGAGEKRGGFTAGKALARISSKITGGLRRCKFDVVSNKLAASPGGWTGSFVIVGAKQGIDDKPKGTARFRLKGKKVSGANALGKKILKSCR